MPAKSTYPNKKERLAELLLYEQTEKEIAEALDVHVNTVGRWKKKYYRELGEVSDKKIKDLRNEFVGSTLQRFKMLERMELRNILPTKDKKKPTPEEQRKGIYAIVNLRKATMEILDRAKVFLPPEQTITLQGGFTVEQLAREFEEILKEYA